jgi:hypothetical protein
MAAALLSLSARSLLAEPTQIFFDDFNRKEVQSERRQVGNACTTNTLIRSPGKRHAGLRQGALHWLQIQQPSTRC